MGNRHIENSAKTIALRLLRRGCDSREIADLCGFSTRTLRQTVVRYQTTGSVAKAAAVGWGVGGREDVEEQRGRHAQTHAASESNNKTSHRERKIGPLSAHVADIIPKLRRLEVSLEERFHSLVPLYIPLPLLQSFTAIVPADDLQHILRSAPKLRERRTWLPPNFHVASKSLLNLEILGNMQYSIDSCGERALDFVTLSNAIRLEGVGNMTPDISRGFSSGRSAPEYMEPVLGMFSWLETLELWLPDEFQTRGPVLLWLEMSLPPKLRYITVKFDAIERIDFSRVVDVLKRRRELQSFQVIGPKPAEADADADPWCFLGRTITAEIEALSGWSLGVHFSVWFGPGMKSVALTPLFMAVDPYENFRPPILLWLKFS
ncbi:hypothetical protein GGX14DRAFT_634034 [Mycena pura]|uniref:Uncharacterized protein n=1 Tax=Mycena pura TaxID=153505 RepID=A0AAD6VDP7_9AGAR|nr:hypothetical protein GGX14DRAFT_634034 [Mycena pura]